VRKSLDEVQAMNVAKLVIVLMAMVTVHSADLTGYRLLVTSIRTGDTEVFIADPATGDLFNVTHSPTSEDRYPCWSPDAREIVFMSDREGTTNLWICNANGSNVRRLIQTPAVTYMPSWQKSPSGDLIVFGMHGDKPEMASIRPDGTDLKMLGDGHDPCISPDGKKRTFSHTPMSGVLESLPCRAFWVTSRSMIQLIGRLTWRDSRQR